MTRFCALLLILTATTNSRGSLHGRAAAQTAVQPTQSRVEWVVETLKSMSTVKPGMTRNDLLKVFTTEGGLSTDLDRTYVSRECPYFKVVVEFEAVGRPARDQNGRVTLVEDGRDIIIKMSKPYLEFSIMD
jgi:hypothetical protein